MNFTNNCYATAALLVFALCGFGFASMQASVDSLIAARKYDNGGLGIVVVDLNTGDTVVSVNADTPMNPASVQKLVTGAAAFEILGPVFSYITNIFIDGPFCPDSGIVNGNMYIRGLGDPGLNAERIWLLVQHLRHRGVQRVTGNLIIDDTYFDDIGMAPGFALDGSRSYQSLISSISPNFSSVGIHHRPSAEVGGPVHIDIFPNIPTFKINSTAVTVDGNRGKLDVSTELKNGTTQINVKGTMGIDERPKYIYRRMWDTWDAFGGAFRAQAQASGLIIIGQTVQGRVPDSLRTQQNAFYGFGGEPLTEFVRHMFKWSSNFVSEMLFKTMGARRMEQPGTWDKGTAVMNEWWKENQHLSGTPLIINGSGMGTGRGNRRTENLMTARQAAELLMYVSKQKRYYPDFLAALPSAGVDGTLLTRFRQSDLRGIVRAKTGTLNSLQVSALAGYLLLADKTYAFAIFCNNVGTGQHDNWIMQEQIVDIVARRNR